MFEVENLKRELKVWCKRTNTRLSGMEYLIRYYEDSLGWNEEKAYRYAVDLFKNGTINQIKILNKDGKEI